MTDRLDPRARTTAIACLIALSCLLGFAGGCSPAATAGEGESDDDSAKADDDEADDDEEDGSDDDSDDDPPAKPPANNNNNTKADAAKPATADAGAVDKTPSTGGDSPSGGGSGDGYCKVKPIIEKYCLVCHTDDGAAPMALVTPADWQKAAPKAAGKKVYEASKTRINDAQNPMPPRAKLSTEELAALNAWLDAKAPATGSDSCGGATTPNPDASGREDGWNPEECDAIYEVRSHGTGGKDTPYNVPPGQEIHPQIRVDAPWGSEKVQAIAFRPITDNKKVLHHWILNGFGRSFLAGWAPGDEGRPPFPKDVGMDMPSGAGAFTLDMHYYNLGAGAKSEPDRSGVEICVLKGANMRPKVAAVATSLVSIGSGGILAPRNSERAPATSNCTVNARMPAHILTAAPHAHKYAVHMKFTVKKKSGEEIVMHDQPFVFGEQGTYRLEGSRDEVVVETGDVITTTCYFTNKTSKDIRFGESTESEMCFNFALYWPKGAFSCGGGGLGGLGGLSFN